MPETGIFRTRCREILGHKDLTIVDNVLPDLDHPNPLAARQAICDIFLKRIVKGKGLDVIVDKTGEEPMPTPWTVFELVKAISNVDHSWKEFMLIDMGGATTDVYSACANTLSPDTVLHGVPEPFVKRTVEGDLGMRVSAMVVGESAKELVSVNFAKQPAQLDAFYHYLRHLVAHPDYLPANAEEKYFDTVWPDCVWVMPPKDMRAPKKRSAPASAMSIYRWDVT